MKSYHYCQQLHLTFYHLQKLYKHLEGTVIGAGGGEGDDDE